MNSTSTTAIEAPPTTSGRPRRRLHILLAGFSVLAASALMLVAAGTASASANGCSGSSCIDVRGTGTYVERIGGGFRTKGCGKSGYYRNLASGTLANGAAYKVAGSWKYVRMTPTYCTIAANFALKSEWFPRKRFQAGSNVCNSVQRYAGGGYWVTDSTACIRIGS